MTFKDFLKEFDAAMDDTETLSAEEMQAKSMQLRRLAQMKKRNPERAKQMQDRQLGAEARTAEDPRHKARIAQRRQKLRKQEVSQTDEVM